MKKSFHFLGPMILFTVMVVLFMKAVNVVSALTILGDPTPSQVSPTEEKIGWFTDVFTTSDRVRYGKDFSFQNVPAFPSDYIDDIQIVTLSRVFVLTHEACIPPACSGELWESTDLGQSWVKKADLGFLPRVMDLWQGILYIAGDDSNIWKYDITVGGAPVVFSTTSYSRFFDLDAQDGYVWSVGNDLAGAFSKSSIPGGARTWTYPDLNATAFYDHIAVYDQNTILLTRSLDSGGCGSLNTVDVKYTTDGWLTKQDKLFGSCGSQGTKIEDVQLLSPVNAIAVGRDGWVYYMKAGVWSDVKLEGYDLLQVEQFGSTVNAIGCCRWDGVQFVDYYYTSTDGGANWSGRKDSGAATQATAATFFSENLGWLGGYGRQLKRYDLPSSVSATTITSPHYANITGLSAVTTYFAVAESSDASTTVESNRIQFTTMAFIPPTLDATPSSLSFTVTEGSPLSPVETVRIHEQSNDATDIGPWTTSADQPWVNFSQTSGALTPQDVNVSVDNTGLTAAGSPYSATITVTATAPGVAGTPQTIPVTLTVLPPNSPLLDILPSNDPILNFSATEGGADPAAQTVTVQNNDGGSLSWTAFSVGGASWLTLNPVAGGNGPTIMTIAPRTGALSAGTRTEKIKVDAGAAGTQFITVNFDVAAGASLQVNPQTLTFTTTRDVNPPDQTFTVGSCGATWSAAASSVGNWLILPGPAAGGPCPSPDIPVRVDVTGLGEATYQGKITVSSPGASPNSFDIIVDLTITPPAILHLDPKTLQFTATEGTNPPVQLFWIFNIGTGTVDWTVDQPPATHTWLRVSDVGCGANYPARLSGSVTSNSPSSVKICIDTAGLRPGFKSFALRVNAPGSQNQPQDVLINLSVLADFTPPFVDPASILIQPAATCVPVVDNYAFVRWDTDEFSDSEVHYGKTVDASAKPLYESALLRDPVDIFNHTGGTQNHEVFLSNLSPGQRYYVKFRSKDRYNNQSAFVDHDPADPRYFLFFDALATCDLTPPTEVVLTVPPGTLSGSVNLTMSAKDQSGIRSFELLTNPGCPAPPCSFSWIGVPSRACRESGGVYACSVVYPWDTPLVKPDGTYTISARAYDAADNSAQSPGVVVEINNATPRVSNVRADPVADGGGVWHATIYWTTDQPSTSRVDYGEEDSAGRFAGYNDYVDFDSGGCGNACTNHTVVLSGLAEGKVFHYRVQSCNPDNFTLCGH